jgi:hypothetical protein
LAVVVDEFVTEEVTEAFKCPTVFETGNGIDQLSRNNFVLYSGLK